MLAKMLGKGTLTHCWWDCILLQSLWKTVYRLLKKLKTELPYDSTIPFLGMYPKEYKSTYNMCTCIPMFIAALFIIAKLWKQPRCPTNLRNGLKKCGIYAQWNFIQPQKRMKFCLLQLSGEYHHK
jgi:hypothetical protein